jgi:hypothetical protein
MGDFPADFTGKVFMNLAKSAGADSGVGTKVLCSWFV